MASIPKKVMERFSKSVPRFQKVLQIAKDRDVNEADTVSVLNDVFGEVLGYDKYLEVTSEFAIRGTYCDLAIKIDDKVQFLIEVKAIGIELKESHMKQACDYGANHGVQWVVLTNGIDWRIYRIRFEQPINFDLVCKFNFTDLSLKNEKDVDCLFMLAREGLEKNARENFYEKVQSVNRYIVGNLILGDPVIEVIRRELRKLSEGMKIESQEISQIIKAEVLKREIVEGDAAAAAQARIGKFYKKGAIQRKVARKEAPPSQNADEKKESVTDRLLREAQEQNDITAEKV